jgi:hypothetical protein
MMKQWQVWMEGYSITGNEGGAEFMGRFEGETFKEACLNWVATLNPKDKQLYNEERNTYWGCRLFDNGTDARKSFG